MSRIVWSAQIKPQLQSAPQDLKDEFYKDVVVNVRSYEKSSQEMEIPDPKAFRSMSRASIFLSHLAMQAKDILAPQLQKSAFSIGIYCAVENGPIDAPSTAKILEQNNPEQFADYYRKFRNPKMYLKQLPNLVPAQLGISLGIQGTMNVYTHSQQASLQALQQAEWDLSTGEVSLAFVCAAHAFDDFLVIKRLREFDGRTINEGAAALILAKNDQFTDWKSKIQKNEADTFGIADQMMSIF